MAFWQVRTQSRDSSGITYLNRLQDLTASFYLNRAPEMSGTFNAESGNATLLGVRPGIDEALLLRDGQPIESVFACTGNSVNAGADETSVTVQWQGIASYLADGIVLGQSTPFSSTTLPWTWINTFQSRTGASVYAITQGTQTGTPPTRQATVEQDAGLLDKIIELAESGNGFDWNIDTARAYNEWHTERGNDNGLTLEYGSNVSEYSYDESVGPGDIVTDVRVIGPPGSPIATASDSTARTTYGRREISATFFADFESATVSNSQLTAHATRLAAERTRPLIIPRLKLRTIDGTTHPSVAWGTYWLGDTIRFKASVGAFGSLDASYRIVAIHIAIDENHNESVELELNTA